MDTARSGFGCGTIREQSHGPTPQRRSGNMSLIDLMDVSPKNFKYIVLAAILLTLLAVILSL
jgi:hypothetical protein